MPSPSTRTAGVIGWPLTETLSPWFQHLLSLREDADLAYVPLRVRPEDIEPAVQGLLALGFVGANVTVPHKEAVLPIMDALSREAEAIGAVNTIVCRDGTLIGENTDWLGFRERLKLHGGAKGKRVVVLGAGGAARAIVYALGRDKAAQVSLLARRMEQVETLLQQVASPFADTRWGAAAMGDVAALHEADIIVNTTPLGMQTRDPLPVPEAFTFRPDQLALDLIASPTTTPFLERARQDSAVTENGFGMLIEQGIASRRLWLGDTGGGGVTVVEGLRQMLPCSPLAPEQRNIVLTGFMAAGKTTVGRVLAKNLGRSFIDTDAMIAERAGMRISEIFATQGETQFRAIERNVILHELASEETVIALGGGAFCQPSIHELLRITSRVVFVDTPLAILLERLQQDTSRPLSQESVVARYHWRRPFYERAHATVNGEQAPAEIARAIAKELFS